MKFEVKPLPYAKDALAPVMSEETLEFHYEKHHKGYMKKLAKHLDGNPLAQEGLIKVVRGTQGGAFNCAAQVYNHRFFWRGLSPQGGGDPTGDVKDLLVSSFGSIEKFKAEWLQKGSGQFGSGWVWLVYNKQEQRAEIISTGNAETAVTGPHKPLLVTDVWEHAYYIDYRNARGTFIERVMNKLTNWNFVKENLDAQYG